MMNDVGLHTRNNVGIAGLIDVETTGLSPYYEEIIELALVAFLFDYQSGEILEVTDVYQGLREPGVSIKKGAAQVHGISFQDVAGKQLDDFKIREIITKTDFLVAHNASFDRGFVLRLFPEFAHKPWLCSVKHINWYQAGHTSRALQYLLCQYGIIPEKQHRAADDTLALLKLLSKQDNAGQPYFKQIADRFRKERKRTG